MASVSARGRCPAGRWMGHEPRLPHSRCNSSGSSSSASNTSAALMSSTPRPPPADIVAPSSRSSVSGTWYLDLLDKVSAHAAAESQLASAAESRRRNCANNKHVLELLEMTYDELEDTFYSRRGYIIPKSERCTVNATGGSATYGELMPEGVQAMIEKLDMCSNSVFVDLGSGLGRAVAHVALSSPCKKVIGVELSVSRHEQAVWVMDKLQQQHGCSLGHVELLVGDVTLNSSYKEGTHFLLCSTAFSASACKMIAGHLASMPSFQVLVTSRQLPPIPSLRKVGEFACAYSWNLGGQAHVYTRNNLLEAPVTCLSEFLSDRRVAWLPHIHAWHIPITAEETLYER